MALNILVVEDEESMIALYRTLFQKQMPEHHLTEVQQIHDVWGHIRTPFDIAFLDLQVDDSDAINGLDIAAELKQVNPSIYNVMVTGNPDAEEMELDNINQLIIKGPSFSRDITDVVDEQEKRLLGPKAGGFVVDYWDSATIRKIDESMERSALRGQANSSDRETDFANSLNGLIHLLRRNFSYEAHCSAFAGLAFARVAGYTLQTEDKDLYNTYQRLMSNNMLPDFAEVDKESCRKFLFSNQGSALLRLYNRVSRPLQDEVVSRLDSMSSKKTEITLADRVVVHACLMYSAITNSFINYRGTDAFRAYDQIMKDRDLNIEFSEDLR